MVANPGKYIGSPGHAPTITPPSVPPSSPLVLTRSYSLGAGGILYFTAATGITQDGVGLLSNSGGIYVISGGSYGAVTGVYEGTENPATHVFDNNESGILSVEALAGGGTAYGYNYECNPVQGTNAGVIQAVSLSGDAFGIYDYGCYSAGAFTNERTGLLAVWAAQTGFGIWGYQSGVEVANAGIIYVTAGKAIGVEGASAFTNSGWIIARDNVADGNSVAVDISEPATFYGGKGGFVNSGRIQADTAFLFDTSGYSPPYASNVTISNSGTIVGAVDLSTNSADSLVENTGVIAGAVKFGNGNNTYSGTRGTQTGDISLGSGVNEIELGANGGTVYGSLAGGADTVLGAGGIVFVQLYAGSNTITGGGAITTVSFAGAANGAVVNLKTGVASCNGIDRLDGVGEVIGSTYFRNILYAGATGAEFLAGNAGDKLIGAAGDDTLVAGTGGDVMTGGGGANLFVYSSGDHVLVITDYRRNGDNDTLDIYGYASARSVTQYGTSTLIALSATDKIVLWNTSAASLALSSIRFIPDGHFTSTGAAIGTMGGASSSSPGLANAHNFIAAMSAFGPVSSPSTTLGGAVRSPSAPWLVAGHG